MTKYIHYCWFGDKPFPKLAKKCLKSWKKYLPDFEIIKWSEENVDLEECPFIKEAYKNKKWAFVADYVRCKALKEMGGIYFDTDMEVTKDITPLLENETFLGVEDTGYVAVGVWYESKKNAYLPTELLKKYREFKSFDVDKMPEFSIPRLISKILEKDELELGSSEIQVLREGITIYPRDYFYPYSYNRDNNTFTENTCMIHYYDASWLPLKSRIENNMVRKLGKKNTFVILEKYRKAKHHIRQIGKKVLFPVVIYKRSKDKKRTLNNLEYRDRINQTIESINTVKSNQGEYLTFYNKNWIGVTNATIELFDNLVDCGELLSKKDIKLIGDSVLDSNTKQVIFSSFAIGWYDLVKYIKQKNANIKIKTFWHGSHSQILDSYGWDRNREIIDLHKKGLVDVMATCKESLENFYEKEGFNSIFLTNKVSVDNKKIDKEKNKSKEIVVGIYAAKCDDWRKNMYTQMAAASMIENAVIDMVPLNENAINFAKTLGVKLVGENKPLAREKLLERMSHNSVNLYVTFSECAPMLPLESMEMGVVCISGNNHHYFKNNPIEEYVVVKNEESVIEIKNKIMTAIKEKDKIIKMYNETSKKNKEDAKNRLKKYLEM